jgi:HK97 family phage major capsid protein
MPATDSLVARYAQEIDDRQTFIDGLVEAAERETRDINAQELELITRARDRIQIVNGMLEPLRETARISADSRERTARLQAEIATARSPELAGPVEYRSAGAYVLDYWRAGLGVDEAISRLDLYHRAASHQTTGDNPGLLPEQILGPVVNFIDAARPLVSALGPRQLPNGSWSRPKVTQHTLVAAQAGEKTELASRKMTVSKVPVAAATYGGYVNVSRQDIDWTQPSIMDLVISDLAAEYAIQTELVTATQLTADATPSAGAGLGATPTPVEVAAAVWAAAGEAYSATKGQGRLIIAVSPDMLGLIGPLFAPINPLNAQSSGFSAGSFGQGVMGAVSGISVVMSSALVAGTVLVISTAAAEVYEDRIGALQVVEPSVLGVQVAYAGYFAALTMEDTGIIAVATA